MYATDLVPALQELADTLTQTGIVTSIDPTTIETPGAWLTVETMIPERLCGDMTVTCALYLIARDTGHIEAITHLSAMLDTALGLIAGVTQVTPDSISLPGSSGTLPCFRLILDL